MDTIIGTDQNFDLIKLEKHKHTADLLEHWIFSGLIPTITSPTRVTHCSSTLIDNIYINFKQDFHNMHSGILLHDISDHFPIFMLVCRMNKNKKKPLQINTRSLDDQKLDKLDFFLDWSELNQYNTDDAIKIDYYS